MIEPLVCRPNRSGARVIDVHRIQDGFQTLAELRQLPGYRSVPAVFMTAQLEPNTETLAPYQPVAVIMKPFEPSGLKEELESILNTMNIDNPGT